MQIRGHKLCIFTMVRVKRRYIVLKINCQRQANPPKEAFVEELKERLCQVYGDFGVACLNRGYSVKRYDLKVGNMILCVRKGVHEMVMSILPLITSIDHKSCNVSIIHLSGTIRSSLNILKEDYIQNLRQTIAQKQELRSHTSIEIYEPPVMENKIQNPEVKTKLRSAISKKSEVETVIIKS